MNWPEAFAIAITAISTGTVIAIALTSEQRRDTVRRRRERPGAWVTETRTYNNKERDNEL